MEHFMKYKITLTILSILFTSFAWSHDIQRENIQNFILKMVNNHNFTYEEVSSMLSKAESKEKILVDLTETGPAARRCESWFGQIRAKRNLLGTAGCAVPRGTRRTQPDEF